MTHHFISSQYITKEKINVTILNVINPAHFVVKETPDLTNVSSKAKRFLEAEEAMQKYYASVQPGFFQLPLRDAIIVVLLKEKFYRAKVITILNLSAGHLFKVYLVDYGIECSVSREKIYEIARDFLLHPFQAVDLKLLGIEPVSLIMDKTSITMSYGPVTEWDPSAGIFVRELKKNMCSAYIEVQGIDDSYIYGRLYLCFESSPVKCINEELISRNFARFNEDCWEKINKVENILGGSEITEISSSSATVQSDKSENVNLEQGSCTAILSDTETDFGDFKMTFKNPIDGKVVAESSFAEINSEKLADKESELQIRTESCPTKEAVPDPDLLKVENKSSSHFNETTSKTEDQLLVEKHFQKLLKLKSPTKPCSADDTNNKILQTTENDICKNDLPSDELKQTTFTTESKSGSENVSQAQLIAEKRLMKLQQLKRKSVSPNTAVNKNVSAIKTPSFDKEETDSVRIEKDISQIKIDISDDRLNTSVDGCQDQLSDRGIQETPKSVPRQESEPIVMSENQKQLQRLQKKVRLKQQKESLQGIEKPLSKFNQFEELSVNTSCDSSLCDSDSGLNSFSSSPIMSDRIEQ